MNEYHYQRSDKGIERKQSNPPLPKTPDEGSWVIPEGLDAKLIIERYLTEETTSQIAKDYGLTRKALVRWIRTQLPNEWKQAQIVRALCRKDDADEQIERAADPLSLARAREMLKSGQWDLERLDDDYKQNQQVSVAIAPVFQVVLKPVDNQGIQADMHVMSTSTPNEISHLPSVDKSK